MTKVRIEPGICGFTAIAEAEAADAIDIPIPEDLAEGEDVPWDGEPIEQSEE